MCVANRNMDRKHFIQWESATGHQPESHRSPAPKKVQHLCRAACRLNYVKQETDQVNLCSGHSHTRNLQSGSCITSGPTSLEVRQKSALHDPPGDGAGCHRACIAGTLPQATRVGNLRALGIVRGLGIATSEPCSSYLRTLSRHHES